MKDRNNLDEMQKLPCPQEGQPCSGPLDGTEVPSEMSERRRTSDIEDPRCEQMAQELQEECQVRVVQDIYRPVAMFGKWLGVLPFEGIYKWSKIPRNLSYLLACIILPLIAIALQLLAAVKIAHLHIVTTASEPVLRSISYYALITENACVVISGVVSSTNLYFKTGRLVAFLTALNGVNQLFVSDQSSLKKFANCYFGVALIIFGIEAAAWVYLFKNFDVLFENDDDDVKPLMITVYIGMIILLMSQLVVEVTYVVVVRFLANSFNAIKKQIVNISEIERDCARNVKNMRLTHHQLLGLADEIDNILSPALLTSIITNMIDSSFTTYHLFIIGVPEEDDVEYSAYYAAYALKSTMALVSLLRIAALCIATDESVRQAGNTAIAIYATNISLKSGEVANEVHLFAQLLSGHPLQFSASRFLTIDRGLLATVIGIIVSYVIVMLQFPEDK